MKKLAFIKSFLLLFSAGYFISAVANLIVSPTETQQKLALWYAGIYIAIVILACIGCLLWPKDKG